MSKDKNELKQRVREVVERPVDRREVVRKLGKYAVYTAPVMITLLNAKDANALGSPP